MPGPPKCSVWILGDQLSMENSALAAANSKRDIVVMIESQARGQWLHYHKKKLVLVYSAMRHFAADLEKKGWKVDYHRLEDTPTFGEGMERHRNAHRPERLLLAEPNSFAETDATKKLASQIGIELEVRPTRQFLCGRDEFAQWAAGSRTLLMENHYRRMRKKSGYLMEDGDPAGGVWNLDPENRQTRTDWEKAGRPTPERPVREAPDAVTMEVARQVDTYFPDCPGKTDGFWLPVDRAGARRWLRAFVRERLSKFGDFEDILITGQPVLFHSVLSPMLNLGLLTPAECCEEAIAAFRKGAAPLNAVEGFVRQIIGWREFINGIYWLRGPDYKELNALDAQRPLPDWLYTGETAMNCLHQTITQLVDLGYNHHIQRLMVLGNFILLAGVQPREALRWFLEMYVDAYDWVMAANVIGMICHADGGFMASKPYAASASYINKMSDYCKGCRYKPAVKTGADACPFNYLYWDFYDRHAARFAKNPRVKMMVSSWLKRSESSKNEVRQSAGSFLDQYVPL